MLDTANSVNRDRELIIDEICDELRKGVSHAHDKMIKAHMQGKIEATSADQFGSPLIVSASQGGMKDAVQHLLARNSDINQADGDGSTALHYAVLFNRHQVIQLLLDNNADTEVVNNQGCKPGQMSLHSIYENAFECCRRQVTDTLVRYLSMDWIPPNLTENEWKMNLTDKKVLRTEIIVENGRKTFRCEELEVSSPTENMLEYYTGKTILMFAAEFGMFNVVKVLLKLRADPALKDTTDKDALTLSIENKHFEIAHYINNRLPEGLRQEILDEETKELNDLKILFKHFCTLGTKDLGVQAARTGRSTSRRSTMDFNEYLTFFNEEKPLRETSVSKDLLAQSFNEQMEMVQFSGELDWPNFKQAVHRLCRLLKVKSFMDIPLNQLVDDRFKTASSETKREALKITKTSEIYLQRELSMMRRQLQSMAGRAKDVTSCNFAAYGAGVTTGRHTLKRETYDVYRKLLRAPKLDLAVPDFVKSKSRQKEESSAKKFFNKIDKDRSGNLTRYELERALQDYGFSEGDQMKIFECIDDDKSGSITLHEFLKGVLEGNVSFVGRTSKSEKQESFLQIGLELSNHANMKETPFKILSVSPGLFGQIFKIYSDYAWSDRLVSFSKSSCIYSAPQVSAIASPIRRVEKRVLGINTRFAVVNPFDPRVLAATTPGEGNSLHSSFESLSILSPSLESSIAREDSKEGERNVTTPQTQRSLVSTPLTQRSLVSTPHRSVVSSPSALPSPYPSSLQKQESMVQVGNTDYRAQYKSLSNEMRKSLGSSARLSRMSDRNLISSPDGKLLSEHTRITLIPHHLTITKSCQVLVGGLTLEAGKTVLQSASFNSIKKHRVTRAGLSLLRRVVFSALSFGAGHCAAVTDTGLVYTWGQGRYGQLGHGDDVDKIIPQPVPRIKGEVKSVSAGFYHTVAVTHHGALFTWGDGKEGKLGHNDNAQRLIPTLVAAFIEWGMPVAAAQAGGSHTLVLNRRGQVFSFGSGDSGRLGHGNDNDQWSPTFLSALESERCVSIAAGFAHSVALTDQGQIYTWGCGKLGRLGHGSDSDEVLPRKLALISHDTIKAIAVAAGEAHTCIFRSEGSLITLGRVSHGRMAEGSCAQDMLDTLHTAISRQSSNDWHHFPS